MTESSGSELSGDEYDLTEYDCLVELCEHVNNAVCDWTLGQDSNSHQKRSRIIDAILNNPHNVDTRDIHGQSLKHLKTFLESGWDVNEILDMPDNFNKKQVQMTALNIAAYQGTTKAVKMLLRAGAKCMIPGVENPLSLALEGRYYHCYIDLIDLLLKHGADPRDRGGGELTPLQAAVHSHHSIDIIDKLLKLGADPNDHDGRENIPLLDAIRVHTLSHIDPVNMNIVQLLLEHGADPNVRGINGCPLSAALDLEFEVFAALLKTLVEFGADVNYAKDIMRPLVYGMMNYTFHTSNIILQKQLDYVFLHGGNINMEYGDHTALHFVMKHGGHSNNIRWLIRHGADSSPVKVILLKEQFMPGSLNSRFPQTPLLLLQAGMRVSHGAQTQLSNMEVAISTFLQDNTHWNVNIYREHQTLCTTTQAMWAELEEAEKGEPQRMQSNFRKLTFPEYLDQQIVDLQDFSDESLYVYPEDIYLTYSNSIDREIDRWRNILHQIHKMMEFLSRPQSLQWYCRRCVRENLVSLQPSVVKTLLIPAVLKCYIMCHEI